MDLKTIVESLIFVSGRVLGTSEILEILKEAKGEEGQGVAPRHPTGQELAEVLETLQNEWQGRGGAIQLVRVAEGYEFRTAPEVSPWVRLLNRIRPVRLSRSAVETLAMIAYRQPITRHSIESIRGVDSGAVLKGLLERRLIRAVGRKEEPGRPILYATTPWFLEFFGLQDLDDLPPLKELEEMIHQGAASQEDASQSGDNALHLSGLIATPEDLSTLEASDREALEELDQSLKDLKEVEKTVLASPELATPGEDPGGAPKEASRRESDSPP